ncbi:MAG: hypothetical protein FWG83_06545, partial [Oscillospiraceae bacterium]|nr:hypothetical protein [Oscillospiraceae bacterium]
PLRAVAICAFVASFLVGCTTSTHKDFEELIRFIKVVVYSSIIISLILYVLPFLLLLAGVILFILISRKLKSDIAELEQELEELEESEEE